MLNFIWGAMMLAGILWAAIQGNLDGMTEGIVESAAEAISLCMTMLGIMSFWCGILKIGERSGLVDMLSKKMLPFIRFLFPNISRDHSSIRFLSTNIIANMLGLGWAATPAGLKAMKELESLEEERRQQNLPGAVSKGTANDEMCTFLILNISSLQLIPINMIAYRSQYGSSEPAAIVGPTLAATMISSIVGILFCKWMEKKGK